MVASLNYGPCWGTLNKRGRLTARIPKQAMLERSHHIHTNIKFVSIVYTHN